ncbi:MAG: class I SAM-dependent methyltransferase [Candidatus Dormibacteraceae bacterium]
MPEDPRRHFGPVAHNYTVATYHTNADRLREILDLAQLVAEDVVLDAATGTGNVALALAPRVDRVVGVDLTSQMLLQGRRVAEERGISNVDWVNADVHRLPFAAASFDLYTVRAAPHHFRDLRLALEEAERVLRRGGRACFIDCAPPAEAADLLHEIEIRRDPSHVRSRSLEEWTDLVGATGLEIEVAERRELFWAFDDWMDNMSVSKERRLEMERILDGAPPAARAALRPERIGGRLHHAYWHAMIRARKP